jgi:hypothetical protein
MLGRLLCRIGLHSWKLSNGAGYTRSGSPMLILFDKDCRRCRKHAEGHMVI